MMLASRSGFTFKRATPPAPAEYWGLTFTAEEAGSTISMARSSNSPRVSLETSVDDGVTWTQFVVGTTTITLANIGDKVSFRAGDGGTGGDGKNTTFATSARINNNVFVMSGKIAASGDISSILDRDGSVQTISSNYTFGGMFTDCTSLTTPPSLPATTIAQGSYACMFIGCTGLTTAPSLPATTVALHSYMYMFEGCSSLSAASDMHFLEAKPACCSYMYKDCTGIKVTPSIPATTLSAGCYPYMFAGCSNLETVTDLPATSLIALCYSNMFKDCTSLKYIKVGFSEWPTAAGTASPTYNWLLNVPDTGTFVCPSALPHDASKYFGNERIPTGWTVQTF